MAGKKKPSDAERACLDEIDGFEADATAELLREFGVMQTCDAPPRDSVSPQSSQIGKRNDGVIKRPSPS